jgi:hypothetical protein
MKPAAADIEVRDVRVEHGCLLCGEALDLRVGPAGAWAFCGSCRVISHPTMRRDGGEVHVVHAVGTLA